MSAENMPKIQGMTRRDLATGAAELVGEGVMEAVDEVANAADSFADLPLNQCCTRRDLFPIFAALTTATFAVARAQRVHAEKTLYQKTPNSDEKPVPTTSNTPTSQQEVPQRVAMASGTPRGLAATPTGQPTRRPKKTPEPAVADPGYDRIGPENGEGAGSETGGVASTVGAIGGGCIAAALALMAGASWISGHETGKSTGNK